MPDYAPIPPSALGPAVNAQGYFVGRVQKNLYWVTDSTYQAAFLTTRDGVVLFDAPPTIGHNLQRAIDEVASANGVPGKVTHIVNSRSCCRCSLTYPSAGKADCPRIASRFSRCSVLTEHLPSVGIRPAAPQAGSPVSLHC